MNDWTFQAGRGWYERGYLPHFDSGLHPQLITYRLADSLPVSRLLEWDAELKSMQANYARCERARRIEKYIDEGHGLVWLSREEVAAVVKESLLYFANDRYLLHAWCIMPNHVHVLITPGHGQSLSRIIHTWKSVQANRANKLIGRTGTFWQQEFFDRMIRTEAHFNQAITYVENNPVKAGLCKEPNEWRWSSAFSRPVLHCGANTI